jgi:type II secretory pathway pseudopilin PulG
VKARSEERKSERGTSLIEVVMSLGLMAGVLGSLAGLFVLGAGGVQSGRRASQALTHAHSITEEMRGWSFPQLYEEFGLDGSAPSFTVDTRSSSHTTEWRDEVVEDLGASAYALISVHSIDGTGSPSVADSDQVRVQVLVHWTEGTRHRSVRLASVRM